MRLFTSCCKEKNNKSYCGSSFEEPAQVYTVNIDTQNPFYKKQGEVDSQGDKQCNKRTNICAEGVQKNNKTKISDKIENMSGILNSSSVVHNVSVVYLKQSVEHTPLDKTLNKKPDQNGKITEHVKVDHFFSSESSSESDRNI